MLRFTSSVCVWLSLLGHAPLLSTPYPAPSSSFFRQPKGLLFTGQFSVGVASITASPVFKSLPCYSLYLFPQNSHLPPSPANCPPTLWLDITPGVPTWGMSKPKLFTEHPSPWLFLGECVILASWKLINVGICHYVGMKIV